MGAYNTAGASVVLTAYEFLADPRPLRLWAYAVVLAVAAIVLGTVFACYRHLVDERRALGALYAWTVVEVLLVGTAVALSGGGRSSLYLMYALTSVFVVSYYPRRSQVLLGALTLVSYMGALAVDGWNVSTATLTVRVGIVSLVAVMGAFIAAEKDRLAAESMRRAHLLEAVTAAAREVNVLDAGRVLAAVIRGLDKLGLEWAHVSLIDESSGTYSMVHAQGIPEEYLRAATPVGSGIVGLVYRSRDTVLLDRDEALHYVVPVLNQRTPELTAVIGSPLWLDGQLAGVLAGASRRPQGLRPEDAEAFELLAGVASRALEGARRFEQMAQSEARNRHQASHDDLTGLANRSLLNLRLREQLSSARPNRGRVALLLVDLDDFKLVNDTLGHGAGDQLLVTVASRLLTCMRDGDTVARLSGDEFAILVIGLGPEDLDRLARRLLEALSRSSEVGGHSMSVDASIGIALGPATPLNEVELDIAAAELLSNADMAMYEAKRAGKHCHVVFDRAMSDRLRKRMAIEAELPHAIEDGELRVLYQPIFELGDRSISGFEALLRWTNPRLGQVSPVEFIPIAEETGAIIPIGRWVLQQACAELQALRSEDAGWAGLGMSVNLSTRQLRDPALVEHVKSCLAQYCIPAHLLTLEITESSLLQDTASSQARLGALGLLGVQVALDDFGTGYSSLSYLQQLHVNCLKVDKSFVDGLESQANGTGRALIRSIAELGCALDLRTIAEGIETEGQLEVLSRLGCGLGQGWVFAPAVPPERMRELLRSAGASPRAEGGSATAPAEPLRSGRRGGDHASGSIPTAARHNPGVHAGAGAPTSPASLSEAPEALAG